MIKPTKQELQYIAAVVPNMYLNLLYNAQVMNSSTRYSKSYVFHSIIDNKLVLWDPIFAVVGPTRPAKVAFMLRSKSFRNIYDLYIALQKEAENVYIMPKAGKTTDGTIDILLTRIGEENAKRQGTGETTTND